MVREAVVLEPYLDQLSRVRKGTSYFSLLSALQGLCRVRVSG